MPTIRQRTFAFFVIGLMGLTMGLTSNYYGMQFVTNHEVPPVPTVHHLPTLHLSQDVIEAKAAIVFDPRTGDILYQKNAQMQLPLASLTKLATARAVLSSANKNEMVIIKPQDLKPDGDSGLKPGDVWRLADLVAFGLTTSSNDAMAAAASALSPGVAVSRMNQQARDNGLDQSYYLNPTGLDISSSTAGAYGSAFDVARLVNDTLREYPEIFEATTHTPKLSGDSGKGAEPTTEPIWNMPGLIAAKTGYTDLAGGNLAAVVDLGLGEPVIAVVLGSSIDGRFTDVKTLVEAERQNVNAAQ